MTFDDKLFLVQLINHFIIYFGVLMIVLYLLYRVEKGVFNIVDKFKKKLFLYLKTRYLKSKELKISTIEK